MRIKQLLLPAAALSLMTFAACDGNYFDCIYGNGEYDEIEKSLPEFYEIELNASFDIEIYHDDDHSVEISGDENIVDLITAKVLGDKLILDYNVDCVDPRKDIKVKIYVNELNEIELNGSGNASTRDAINTPKLTVSINGSGNANLEVFTNDLRVDIDGSGDVDIEGKGSKARYYIDGSGDIDAFDFESDTCVVTIDGSGDVGAWVNDTLTVSVLGSGDLEYIGNPALNILDDSGSGIIRRR
ncbi:MAG: DUF2807 domain-containing protein, partial [Bacteroidetes bacterium]|nr:DUF2807 domain-containing protein [Bacteroidota bacterium]